MSDDDVTPGRELATVTHLPARQVLEGEIVTEEQYRELTSQRGRALARREAYRRDVATVTRVTRQVVTHDRTKTVLRHGTYVAGGVVVLAKRAWEAKTNSVPNRMVRSAMATGNMEAAAEWYDRGEKTKDSRHKRVMDWLRTPLDWFIALAWTCAGGLGLLLALGVVLAVTSKDVTQLFAPIQVAFWIVAGIVTFVTVAWVFLLCAIAVIGVTACWAVGRHADMVPAWLAKPADTDQESVIVTPQGVAGALAHLGIGPLNKAIKDGWEVEFSTPPVLVNNRGYQVVHSLPMGVTPGMIADKRDVLARNLIRAPLEVWPVAAERAGYVDLWVAHQGATERPAPPYPLLQDGTADVFTGVPLAVSQRGDVISPPLFEANFGFGGMMGQGKSNAARVLAAGAALDPICEIDAFVFAGNGDFDAYEPRLARYRRGVDDAVARDAVEALRELYADVAAREARLADLGAKKVSRGLALKHPELRPRLAIFSECHELFGHAEYGKEAADLAVQTLRRSRKTAIMLAFDTQSSRAEAIPPKIVELLKINACFAVKTWRSNDGFLGDGSFQAGIRATELRPGKDVGTSVLTGATTERFEIVKWFYIEADDDRGYDAATDIIARAMRNVRPTVTGAGRMEVERDLLTDVADCLNGEEAVKATDMAARLRRHAPDHLPYRHLDGRKLADQLHARHDVEVKYLKGTHRIRASVVFAAIDRREDAGE